MTKNLPSGFRKVTHCIFDMDGLLLDSEPIYEKITDHIAGAFNISYPLEVRMKVRGRTEQDSAVTAIRELKLPITLADYMKQYYKMSWELLGDAPLLKGAERLIRHLYECKVPFALATSSGEEMVDLKTTHHKELFKLFHHKVCGSTDADVKSGKPAPDIFLVAASRFPTKPASEHCLVFEDAPNGVQAACAAGMQCIMVPDERVPKDLCAKATQVLKSLEDFKPEDFGLPPFKS